MNSNVQSTLTPEQAGARPVRQSMIRSTSSFMCGSCETLLKSGLLLIS